VSLGAILAAAAGFVLGFLAGAAGVLFAAFRPWLRR